MRTHGRLHYVIALALAGLLICLGGCSTITARLSRWTGDESPAAPGTRAITLPTLAATPQPTAGLAAEQPTPWPTSTTAPSLGLAGGVATPLPTTTPAPPQDLLFLSGGSLMRGGDLGESPREVAQVHDVSSWSLAGTRLALLQGSLVQVIDFSGNAQDSFTVDTPTTLESATLLWGTTGQGILHVAVVADAQAPTHGRHVELRALRAADGTLLGGLVIPDVAGATALRYDDALGQVLLIAQGGDPSFAQVDLYDLGARVLLRSVPAPGEGAVALSPDGTTLLTTRTSAAGSEMLVYDLAGNEPGAPLFWEPPSGTRATSFAWSPTGRQVAYLLREGEDVPGDDPAALLGVWIVDLETMGAVQAIAEQGSDSALLRWTPDGASVLVHHSDGTDGAHYYTVRPDGGGLRILPVNSESRLIGWLARDAAAPSEPVGIDPWLARFASTSADAAAAANMAAAYVAEHPDVDDALLSEAVAAYLAAAGWEPGPAEPRVIRLAQDLAVAQLPGMTIQLLVGGQAHHVARGDLLIDARQEDRSLGLIYGVVSETGVQPAYMLLQQGDDGTWATAWTPQGQYEWIATDGEIAFSGQGLAGLAVSGSSFGLDYASDSLFAECHTCPHRQLRATWVRDEAGYHRETKLPAGASFEKALWEMTTPGPYAVLHEVLRRLAAGESLDDLLSGRGVRAALDGLHVVGGGARFVPEDETADAVTFLDARNQARYRAVVRDGRLAALEALGN